MQLVESVLPANVGAAKHDSVKASPRKNVFEPPVALLNVEVPELVRPVGHPKRHDVRHHQLLGRVGLLEGRDESLLGGGFGLLERPGALRAGKGPAASTGPATVQLVTKVVIGVGKP